MFKKIVTQFVLIFVIACFCAPLVFAQGTTTPSETSNDDDFKKCFRDTFNQERTTVCADILVEDKKCADSVFQDPVIRGCVSLNKYELGSFGISRISDNISVCPNGLMDKIEEDLRNCGRIYTAQCYAKIRDYCGEKKTPAAPPTEPKTEPEPQKDKPANPDPLGSFDVSQYLKIKDGQSYLESGSTTGEETNLKKGLVYFIIKFIELITKIIGSFALLFVITGGVILMASHGNSQLQTRGKQMILYALLGLIVAFLSLIIVTFVQSLFFTA